MTYKESEAYISNKIYNLHKENPFKHYDYGFYKNDKKKIYYSEWKNGVPNGIGIIVYNVYDERKLFDGIIRSGIPYDGKIIYKNYSNYYYNYNKYNKSYSDHKIYHRDGSITSRIKNGNIIIDSQSQIVYRFEPKSKQNQTVLSRTIKKLYLFIVKEEKELGGEYFKRRIPTSDISIQKLDENIGRSNENIGRRIPTSDISIQKLDENIGRSNENNRLSNENNRLSNENNRLSNKINRLSNENNRLSNENNRLSNENNRLSNENNSVTYGYPMNKDDSRVFL